MGRGVVVITGASAGVGRAAARAFANRGWDVGLIARGDDGLKATREELIDRGVRALDLSVDVADPVAVDRAAEAIEGELGPIDAWVNNAMAGVFGTFLSVPAEDFRRVTDVTYLGTVNGTRAALARMVSRDRGVIVQVGSALAYRGIPLQSAYCGAKHAIRGFTSSVRTELEHDHSGIRLCEVHLPAMNTPQFRWVKSFLAKEAQPVPPIYQPEIAADAIAHVVEHPRRETWVGASTIATVLANMVAPRLLDRYLARAGFAAQQTEEDLEATRAHNLYRPVAGDHGAHGAFDDRATARSAQMWISHHRSVLGGGLAVAAAIATIGGRWRPRSRRPA